jgi:hypothetical protein
MAIDTRTVLVSLAVNALLGVTLLLLFSCMRLGRWVPGCERAARVHGRHCQCCQYAL